MNIENKTARPIILNVMVGDAHKQVILKPGMATPIDKKIGAQLNKDAYFKANIVAKNVKIVGVKKTEHNDQDDYTYTTAEAFLKSSVAIASANAKYLTLEQLDEAVQVEELKGEGVTRTTLVSALIKAAEDLD